MFDIHTAMHLVREAAQEWAVPVLSRPHVKRDPFRTLVACVLSLRTKDETTHVASERLFARADTPVGLLALGEKEVASLIYPVGFYNRKARQIVRLCDRLIETYGGVVPDEIDELLTLGGVGRKTANLVVTEAFGKPGICVDTHVHRIVNRWGYVTSKTPEETERRLRERLPSKYWLTINRLLVSYGKHCCTPLSPKCSECAVRPMCARKGVRRSR